MLDSEQQTVAFAGDVEVGVSPGPEVAASPRRPPGQLRSVLAGMVHQSDGGFEATRQLAEG
jgi:hypothetical protein